MKTKNEHKSLGHPLATGSLLNNVRLLWKNGGMDGRYALRALNIFLSNLALLPFRLVESHQWAERVKKTQIREPPLFIIGVWRSGTTYLHDLLVKDDRWGYVSTLQAFCPDICMEGSAILFPIFRKLLPKKRPNDNVRMAIEYPQEEEYAVGNLSSFSFYHGYSLPRSMPALLRTLSFTDDRNGLKEAWKNVYLQVLKKATLIMGGKRLVLKNPLSTTRIPALLEMFPGAKFIFLYRDPYRTYSSLVHWLTKAVGAYQLEAISRPEIEEYAFCFYETIMRRYWDTKDLIPQGNLVEIRYEDLDDNTLAVVERIYEELGLPGFESARDAFEKYILSQEDYEKNVYTLTPETAAQISRRWRFAIERLGYPPPSFTP